MLNYDQTYLHQYIKNYKVIDKCLNKVKQKITDTQLART